MSSRVRIAGVAAWQILLFLINGAVFILIGLQLPTVLAGLAGARPLELLGLAAADLPDGDRRPDRLGLPRDLSAATGSSAGSASASRTPPPRNVFIVSWAGMRGVVSLAAALALPRPTAFPERDLLIFLTFAVILATLVGQGLTLPLVIRGLRIAADGGADHEEAHARHGRRRGRGRPDRGARRASGRATCELIDALRAQYSHRASHIDGTTARGRRTRRSRSCSSIA